VFYLVPPTTAIQAWICFGESFDMLGVLGFVMAAMAVYLVVKKPVLFRPKLSAALSREV
jgi:drug/metabolite transporter (DMT)-like permease